MSYFLFILFVACCTLVGVWGFRIWEITQYKKSCLFVKVMSPFIGAIILLAMGFIILTGMVGAIWYLAGYLWKGFKVVPYHMISIFVSSAMIANSRFKLSPVIDDKSHAFWRWAVMVLNLRRSNYSDHPYIDKIGPILIRDPHANPMRRVYVYSKWHPFMFQKKPCKKCDEWCSEC